MKPSTKVPAMGKVLLGHAHLCLNVKDVNRSLAFYKKLGFKQVGGNVKQRYVILQNGSWPLGLFQGHITSNLVNLRGGDVKKICAALKKKGIAPKRDATEYKGGVDAVVSDPDGNAIYIDTMDDERLG